MDSDKIKHSIRDQLKVQYCEKLERYKLDFGFKGKPAVKKLKYIAQNYLDNERFMDKELRMDLKDIMANRIYHLGIVISGLEGLEGIVNIEENNWINIMSRFNFYNEGEEGQVIRNFLPYLKDYFRRHPHLYKSFNLSVTASHELREELLYPNNMESLLEKEINSIKNRTSEDSTKNQKIGEFRVCQKSQE